MDKDTITLISPDRKEKIVCYKYMEECFRKEGYRSSKIIHVNLLYKLYNFKIIKKIRSFLSLTLRCKFFFKDPEHSELVIFDSENIKHIEKVLPSKNFIIISTRIGQINKIYVSKKIIFYIVKNLFKRSLKKNYLTVLINVISPKIVLTHVSDSEDFHAISKILHSKIKFIAIQTYNPTMYNEMFSAEAKKNFFIPKLFCYGKCDELFYKNKKVNIGAYEVIGSLQSSLSYEYVKSEKLKINPNKYDICLISEIHFFLNKDWSQVKNYAECFGLVAEFTHRLCRKHNLNMIFTGKVAKDTVSARREIYFYKHYLKNYNFEIFQPSKETQKYSSYINIMQSKLTIALFSTMLREAISFEKKILSFNTAGHPDVIFPGPGITFPQESICILTKPSYELFEERVLKILSMTNKEYFSQLGKEKSFLVAPAVETASVLRKRLKQILEFGA